MKTITITNHTRYHHLPDHADYPDCYGLTLRKALKTLREVDYGNLGGTHRIDLSDGSHMQVRLTPTESGGSRLMSSQRCVREDSDRGREYRVAVYPI